MDNNKQVAENSNGANPAIMQTPKRLIAASDRCDATKTRRPICTAASTDELAAVTIKVNKSAALELVQRAYQIQGSAI